MEYRFSPIACRHCQRTILWPRWARVEHCYHIPLCWPCYERLDQDLTPEHAVLAAIIIVGIHAGRLNAQVQR